MHILAPVATAESYLGLRPASADEEREHGRLRFPHQVLRQELRLVKAAGFFLTSMERNGHRPWTSRISGYCVQA